MMTFKEFESLFPLKSHKVIYKNKEYQLLFKDLERFRIYFEPYDDKCVAYFCHYSKCEIIDTYKNKFDYKTRRYR
jgi:hypothetical protein